MPIIKLSAINSTNTFLRQLSSEKVVEDYTVVMAESQTKGRGQMGTQWNSQPSKNLMASVFVDVSFLEIEDSFYLSKVISLAISRMLKDFQIRNVKIKWPNDILADQKKIAGILIENVIKNTQLQGTIIGFGLNVNQLDFQTLPSATSMQLVSGKTYDIDEVLQKVLHYLKFYMSLLQSKDYDQIKGNYEAELFRIHKPSTFQDVEGALFLGFIKGVSNSGHLQVMIEDNIIKEFDLKEIKLLY